jgi:hypothetical protein
MFSLPPLINGNPLADTCPHRRWQVVIDDRLHAIR